MKYQEKYAKYAIAIIIFAILLRLFITAIAYPSGDSCWHLSAARFIAENSKIPATENLGRDEAFWPAPLFHISAALVYFIFKSAWSANANVAEMAARFVTTLFGSLSIVIVFLLINRMFGIKQAFYSVLFVSFLPLHIYFSTISYVDSALLLFVLLSVYFMILNRPWLAGIFSGLSILAKFTGIFVIPVLVYIAYFQNEKIERINRNKIKKNRANVKVVDVPKFAKTAGIVIVLSLLVASPWYIRNYSVFGNPFYPFMQKVFGGEESGLEFGFDNLFHARHFSMIYLETYGVPNGQASNLFYFDIPMINLLVVLWLIATILFTIPLIMGLVKLDYSDKNIRVCLVLFASFFVSALLYIISANQVYARLFVLPGIPFVCIAWSKGIEAILDFNPFKKKAGRFLVFVAIISIMAGFVAAETIKAGLAAREWNVLKQDFGWLKSKNSESIKESDKRIIVYSTGQCTTYNTAAVSLSYNNAITFINGSYIFVTKQESGPVCSDCALSLVHENKKSGTRVYFVNK